MKKFICILLVILLLTLSGCAGMEVVSNDLYAIREKGGEHYIDFHNDEYNKTAASLKPEASSLTANFISFSSVGEMRSRILSGKFTEEERMKIMTFTKTDSGAVKVCNTNKLYEALLPNDVSLLGVDWYGGSYVTYFSGNGDVGGYITITSQEHVKQLAEQQTPDEKLVVSRSVDSDRNAEVVTFGGAINGALTRHITYTMTSQNSSLTVQEAYWLEESESTPKEIRIWGHINGTYFEGYVGGFTERPSYEWVTSFGLKPYVETETE